MPFCVIGFQPLEVIDIMILDLFQNSFANNNIFLYNTVTTFKKINNNIQTIFEFPRIPQNVIAV